MSTSPQKWITIEEFKGIYSAGTWQLSGANTPGKMVVGAPLGSAQETNTYRCVPGPQGKGLMPAPRGQAQTFARALLTGTPANVTHAYVTGLATFPGVVEPGSFFIGFWTFEPAGVGVRSYVLGSGLVSTIGLNITNVNSAASPDTTVSRESMGFAKSSINATTPYIVPGVWVLAYSDKYHFTRTIPNPASGVGTAAAWPANFGRLLAHQNRIVVFQGKYQGYSAGGAASFYMNSDMLYSDPANSNVFPVTRFNIDAEDLTGFNAFGPLNANTLLLVKGNAYGGLVVQGDLANPIITRVPSVTGGNMISTDACASPLGLVYASGNNGLHVWSGGASSTKISSQLRDDFYHCEAISAVKWQGLNNNDASEALAAGSGGGWGVSCRVWGDYILTSNNFMYHMPSQSWWRIDDQATFSGLYWDNTYWPDWASCTSGAEMTSLGTNVTWGRLYDNALGAFNWSWQSQAIPLSIQQMIGVDEFVITCQGAGTIQVTGTSYTGGTSGADNTVTAPVTVTLPAEAANQPVKIRIPFAIMGYNVVFRMVADNGSNSAPTVYRVDIGYDDTNLVAVQ